MDVYTMLQLYIYKAFQPGLFPLADISSHSGRRGPLENKKEPLVSSLIWLKFISIDLLVLVKVEKGRRCTLKSNYSPNLVVHIKSYYSNS